MQKKCKTCSAPLLNERCDYCGTVHGENKQTTTDSNQEIWSNNEMWQGNNPSTNHSSSNTPHHHAPHHQMPTTVKKLTLNNVAGFFAVLNVVVLTFYNIFFWRLVMDEINFGSLGPTETQFAMLGLFIFLLFALTIATLVLHIVGIVQSKKHGISITGHVLGLVGVGITILSVTIFSIVSIILFLLAAIFSFMQKNVTGPYRR